MLLSNPRVKKAGRLVSSDLKSLQDSIGNAPPFVGALDLAKFAKDRLVIADARCSLSDLCAVVLGRCLRKNVSERMSMAWENQHLTPEQVTYAACDAYAPLQIHHELAKLSVPQRLGTGSLVSDTPIFLYSADRSKVIARGCLSKNIDLNTTTSVFDGISITSTRTLLDISEVYVPGYKVSTHNNRSLESFGDPPFSLVCLRNHVRLCDSDPKGISTTCRPFLNTLSYHPHSICGEPMDIDTTALDTSSITQSSPQVNFDGPDDTLDSAASIETDYDGTGDLTSSLLDDSPEPLSSEPFPLSDRQVDSESAAYGNSVLDDPEATRQNFNSNGWDNTIRSRVLKDIFHVFHMLPISTTHALRKEFGRALRDAIFIPDREDCARISSWGSKQDPPVNFETLRSLKPKWLWRHCKRVIPPPAVLYPLVDEIFRTYGPLKDATTHLPLFNRQAWEKSKQILDLVRQGFVSDPPGIALYTMLGVDSAAGNLPVYRCARGTNFTEGGVHTHLRTHLPSSGTSIRHINASLLDFVLRHNLRVSTVYIKLFMF